MDLLKRTVLRVWAMKQELMRWAASRAERQAWFAETGGVFPAPEQIVIKRPGWRVRVSFWVRRGRGPGHRRLLQTGAGWEEGRARLHVVVTVTASIGHPLLGCSSLEEVPEGVAPRVVFKLKPEYVRKHKGNKNMIDLSRFRQSAALGELQTSPDGSSLRPVQTLAEPLARDRDDPIFRHILSAKGDLLSWLRPENVALPGAPLSESEEIESRVEAFVTKWEKQHGPIPKKELLPHEIG